MLTLTFACTGGGLESRTKPKVQVALLLDTSNSMDGLIEQAKSRLWSIVNTTAALHQDGQRPQIEVALFEYGNSYLDGSTGYIRRVVPMTKDLDLVSENLFSLSTYGGDEFCGQVILDAVSGLEWSNRRKDLKMIFIAGNEPFTQGHVHFRQSCRMARERDIVVNTIFCGNHVEGMRTQWKSGADLTGGSYFSINHNRRDVQVAAPQDKELAQLSQELNETYIPYGAQGARMKERQEEQDRKAEALAPSVLADRSAMKSSGLYQNSHWDLVDAYRDGSVDMEKLSDEALPQEMQGKTTEEQKAYVEQQLQRRADIQKKIQELNRARASFIAEKQQESAGDDTFGKAVTRSIKDQARKKDFETE